MKQRKFYGNRLRDARLFRGYTLTELADKTEISKQSLSLYENDKNIPSHENIINIAAYLDFPIEYFWCNDYYEVKAETTYFRSQASTNKKDRIAQKIKLEHVIKIYRILLDYVKFIDINLPEVNFKGSNNPMNYDSVEVFTEIELIASKVREYWELNQEPIINLQYLLEKNGVIVTGFTLNESKIDAFSQRIQLSDGYNVYIIALGLGSKPKERLNFDMAHELGHILLHPWEDDLETLSRLEFKGLEKQANMFASAFLLPKDTFTNDISKYPTDLRYYQYLKNKWNVSIQAMIYRTQQLNIITPNQYSYLMRQISKKGWRKKEPGDLPGKLNENVFQEAIDVLFENRYFNANSFIQKLKDYGIILYPHDIEDLLQLRKGILDILEQEEKKTARIIELKDIF